MFCTDYVSISKQYYILNIFLLFFFLEYNVMQPPPLNEKVLKDKRKKLKETLDRVLKMYVSM